MSIQTSVTSDSALTPSEAAAGAQRATSAPSAHVRSILALRTAVISARVLPGSCRQRAVGALKWIHLDLLPNLAESDRDSVGTHTRHAVLRHVGAVAVEHEHRAHWELAAEWRCELTLVNDLDRRAEEDRLLGEQ